MKGFSPILSGETRSMVTRGLRQLADVVAERVEQLIAEGALRAEQVLPSERRLTDKLGVSRTALREGLKLLRARGIIETSPGRGSFVANFSERVPLTPMMHLFGSQPKTLHDLLEARGFLEVESAGLAASRGTVADFASITRHYNAMVAENGTDIGASKRARLDHAVHRPICEASHKPILVHTLRSLTDLLLSSVFAAVNNLYCRQPHKGQIDRQHARRI